MHPFTSATRWRRATFAALAALLAIGCESAGLTKKFANPVVPPPPQTRHIGRRERAEPRSAAERQRLADRSPSGRATIDAPAESGDDDPSAATAEIRQGRPAGRPATQRGASPNGAAGGLAAVSAGETRRGADSTAARPGWRSPQPAPRQPGSAGDVQPAAGTAGRSAGDDEIPLDDGLATLESRTEIEGSGVRIEKGEVAATVYGRPIFVDDVLMMHNAHLQLEKARGQLSPEQFRKLRANWVTQLLPLFIQQELLTHALRTKVKDEQLEGMIKHLDSQFEKEMLPSLMKDAQVSTPGELEARLTKVGRSIDTERQKFRNQQMAQHYLSMNVKHQVSVDRADVLGYYREHADEYAVPARVKWQQIHLSYQRHGGKRGAQQAAEQVVGRLQHGEDFAAIAREVSDGPTASRGGFWDWTTRGSVKSAEVDRELFSMPLEECCVIEGDDGIDIVGVLERRDAGYKSFESVQMDIKNKLRMDGSNQAIQDLLAELEQDAVIERFTDRL